MKLSDYKGKDAVELLADLIEPIGRIFSDEEMVKLLRNMKTGNRTTLIQTLLKKHSEEVIAIMAIIDGEEVAYYSPSFFELPKKLLDLFNDEEFTNLFISQGQNEKDQSFGSVTENTTEQENG